jgi:hypothetical protein
VLVAHPIKNHFKKNEEENFEYIIGGKHQKHKLDISLHRESGFKNSTILAIALAKSNIEKNQTFEEVEDSKS